MIFMAGSEPHENADAIVRYHTEEYKGRKYKIIYLTDGKAVKNQPVVYLDKNLVRLRANIIKVIRYCWLYAGTAYLLYENEPIQKVRCEQNFFI